MPTLKQLIKRIPGSYDIECLIRDPSKELEQWRDFFNVKRRFGKISTVSRQTGTLLIVSLLGNFVSAAKIEAFLAKAATFAGLKPLVLTSRWAWANRFYRALGIDSFVYFEDFLTKARERLDEKEIEKAASSLRTFDDLMNYNYHGVNTGKYICSSLVRKTYTGVVNMEDKITKKLVRDYLKETSINAIAAGLIYDQFNPDAVLFLERGYTPYGEFFDIALKRELNVVQWCGSHKNNALMLKRYTLKNQDRHPASISEKTWDVLKKMPWDSKKEAIVKHELFKNYSSGEWFSEVGTQFNTKITRAEETKKMLDLDQSKKTAIIFPHLFWDATFFWGEDIFTNYREWFTEAVKAACKNTHLNWILKFHPANVVKLNRDGYKGELVEKVSIRESIGKLPPHIKILEPTTKISTYSLFSVMDYCLTVRGTIGIESAVFGIPVFTAGTGRYDGLGFTIDSSNKKEYLEKLAVIHTYPRLTPEQIELAQKFAYGTFLLRPFDLESLRISYKKDKKATQSIDYLVPSLDELYKANDTKALGQWLVNSRDEDYVKIPV